MVQWFTPRTLVTLFAPTLDGQTRQLSIDFVRVFAIGHPALGAFSLSQAGFNGAKRTRISLVGSVVKNWGIRLPVAIVGGLVLGHGTVAVFAAIPASDIVTAFPSGAYYHHATKDGLRAD